MRFENCYHIQNVAALWMLNVNYFFITTQFGLLAFVLMN